MSSKRKSITNQLDIHTKERAPKKVRTTASAPSRSSTARGGGRSGQTSSSNGGFQDAHGKPIHPSLRPSSSNKPASLASRSRSAATTSHPSTSSSSSTRRLTRSSTSSSASSSARNGPPSQRSYQLGANPGVASLRLQPIPDLVLEEMALANYFDISKGPSHRLQNHHLFTAMVKGLTQYMPSSMPLRLEHGIPPCLGQSSTLYSPTTAFSAPSSSSPSWLDREKRPGSTNESMARKREEEEERQLLLDQDPKAYAIALFPSTPSIIEANAMELNHSGIQIKEKLDGLE